MGYVVIDGFCENPETVRDSVLAAGVGTWRPNKGEVGSSVYDGMGFWGDHAILIRALMVAVGGAVVPNSMFFRVTNEDTEGAYIHSDRESGNHTCVCYLSDHKDEYGTAFWRHKKTGWTEMPSFEDMQAMGVMDAMKSDMVDRTASAWERTDFVRGTMNRALIFPAPLFHSRVPVSGFGNDAGDGRMVWVCHFNKIAPNGTFL